MVNHPNRSKKGAQNGVKDRTSQALRNILFNEIEALQAGTGDPQKAMAVANLARQIVNTVKVELEFANQLARIKEMGGDAEIGTLVLGSPA